MPLGQLPCGWQPLHRIIEPRPQVPEDKQSLTHESRKIGERPAELDFICRYFEISMAIKVVQIGVVTALALALGNDFTFVVCFNALKNSFTARLSL